MLLAHASELRDVDAVLSTRVTRELIGEVVSLIPDAWLDDSSHRDVYQAWLRRRLEEPREWVEEAIRARSLRV